MEDGEEEEEKEEQEKEQSKGKKISATMETNDRLTMPQNCVVQPLLTGTCHTAYKKESQSPKPLHSGFLKEGDEKFQISGHQSIFFKICAPRAFSWSLGNWDEPKIYIRSI